MKSIILNILMVTLACHSFGQKPMISDATFRSWPEVNSGLLSANGKYAIYTINNQPTGNKTLIVTSTDNKWRKLLLGAKKAAFTNSSQFLYYMQAKDSLFRIELRTGIIQYIATCQSYELYKKHRTEYILYKHSDSSEALTIHNINSTTESTYPNVRSYAVSKPANAILILKKNEDGNEELQWVNLTTGKVNNIFSGANSSDYIFDASGTKMAFTVTSDKMKYIYLYDSKLNITRLLADDSSAGIDKNLKISTEDVWSFNKGGRALFFTLIEKHERDISLIDEPQIWSYQDQIIYPLYRKNGNKIEFGPGRNLTILDIQSKNVSQILSGPERLAANIDEQATDFLIVKSYDIPTGLLPVNNHGHLTYFSYDLKTKNRVTLAKDLETGLVNIGFSSNESFLVYYNADASNYFSYKMSNGHIENISDSISKLNRIDTYKRFDSTATGVMKWVTKSNKIIIQGTYDLWLVDLENKVSPENLTSHNNHQKDIVFSFGMASKEISGDLDCYIKGVDINNKRLSIYALNLSEHKFLKMYSTDSYVSDIYSSMSPVNFQIAEKSNSFLFKFQRVNESSNYLYTNDFKSFVQLSDIYPERQYNWLSSELMNYQDSVGNPCQGILYKPENFDSTKKYPVVIQIYQELTNKLHQFISPDPSFVGVNIPLLVSNGYLVFRPNTYLEKGKFGETALRSVVAGVDALSKFTWVDNRRIGLIGHSYGGLEVNYIITHSDKFAASIVEAGASNTISYFNDFFEDIGLDKNGYVGEAIGGRLEEISEAYLKNTPVLFAKNICAPVLFVHNDKDANVPFYHGAQMFMQLRSMNKRTWLLNYSGEMHVLSSERNRLDLQLKIKSFLDYYLKNQPIPTWMNDPIKY